MGRITNGIPLYTGGDSLAFDFSKEFGEMYMNTLRSMTLDSVSNYAEQLPGIYITVDDQTSPGGRINLFDLAIEIQDSYYITGNYAELKFKSTYDERGQIDTSFLFFFGAQDFSIYQEASSYYGSETLTSQYALNLSSHESVDGRIQENAADKIFVEGGGGLKPRITGLELKHLAEDAIREAGGDPATSVINKASVILPFEFPEDYNDMDHWPQVLSPTCRIITEPDEDGEGGMATFMSLSDSSDENANLGDVNRSTLKYSPDITYHVQSLVRIDENDASDEQTKKLLNGSYDVWFLIMANELIETTDVSSSSTNDLYSYLAYQNYYNSIYGYGGYGYGYGYGGYSDYYSNYYTYAMLAAMYSNANTTTQTETVMLDKDRYYNAALNGPDYPDESLVPQLRITFAIPMEEADY